MAAFGGLAGAGAFLMVAGLRGQRVLGGGSPAFLARIASSLVAARAALVAGIAALVLLATGWIAGAFLAAAAVVFGPRLLGGRAGREASIARTEAIAACTEMVRDSIAAASGLEEAITATAPVAPAPIRAEVTVLVRRLEHQDLASRLMQRHGAGKPRHPRPDDDDQFCPSAGPPRTFGRRITRVLVGHALRSFAPAHRRRA